MNMLKSIKYKMRRIMGKKSGMGVIEIILIIVVLVGLAMVFKTQMTGIADGLYKKIKTQVNKF